MTRRALFAGHAPGVQRARARAARPPAARHRARLLPGRHGVGSAQGAGDGDHRGAGAGAARRLRGRRRALRLPRQPRPVHRDPHAGLRQRPAPTGAPAPGSWPTPSPSASGRRRSARGARCGSRCSAPSRGTRDRGHRQLRLRSPTTWSSTWARWARTVEVYRNDAITRRRAGGAPARRPGDLARPRRAARRRHLARPRSARSRARCRSSACASDTRRWARSTAARIVRAARLMHGKTSPILHKRRAACSPGSTTRSRPRAITR